MVYGEQAICAMQDDRLPVEKNLFTQDRPLRRRSAMYALTTLSHINDVFAIARPGVMEKVARLVGGSYYSLPSSPDELS